jgi:uncharacterized membrane protein YcgQ (UPF0703/DUF1980 family)
MNVLDLHEKDSGWKKRNVYASSKVLKYEVHRSYMEEEFSEQTPESLIDSIKYKLYTELMEADCVSISKHQYVQDMSTVYRGEINFMPNGNEYTGLVLADVFKVEEETFSEKELIQAVRKTFPERFV